MADAQWRRCTPLQKVRLDRLHPPLDLFVVMRVRETKKRLWNDRVCSKACCANATPQLDLWTRVRRYSIRSSAVGRANGPRRTTASISAHLLLCVIWQSPEIRYASQIWRPTDNEPYGLLGAVTIDCIMPESDRMSYTAHCACVLFTRECMNVIRGDAKRRDTENTY